MAATDGQRFSIHIFIFGIPRHHVWPFLAYAGEESPGSFFRALMRGTVCRYECGEFVEKRAGDHDLLRMVMTCGAPNLAARVAIQ
jgi:hypothetical protein